MPNKEEMYKRQLGGTNAALNRARQENKDLRAEIEELHDLINELLGYIHLGALNTKEADEFSNEIMPRLEQMGFL